MNKIYVVTIIDCDYWAVATYASTSKEDAEEYANKHGGTISAVELKGVSET